MNAPTRPLIDHATREEPPMTDVPELPAPPAPRSRYVCREHGSPVSWRGTGCRVCAAEQARDRREGADR